MRLPLTLSTIRRFHSGDADALCRHADNRKVWRNLRDRFPHPYSRDDAAEWIRLISSAEPATHFAIEVDGEAAGGIGVDLGSDVHRRVGEIGYWLGEAHWGRGIMSEAVVALSRWAFEHLSIDRLEAPVYAWNPASARVLEKAGYEYEGRMCQRVYKDGVVTDELRYAKIRHPDA